jgi:isocitrate dehydrogenase (NAD+)
MSSVLMLRHLKLDGHADRLENSLFKTIAAGIGTPDIGGSASTAEFTRAVVERLGPETG